MTFLRPFFLLSLSLAIVTLSFGENEAAWLTDYNEAVAEANEKGKDLLLVFTGTDWIEMCQVFDEEILTQPEFLTPVSGEYVLVKLEYPENNRLPRDEAKGKQLLRDAYRVQGYPTVILTDPEGRPYGINGYQPVTPAVYGQTILKMHETRLAAEAKRIEAAEKSGVEKAGLLAASVPDLPGILAARYYREEMEMVIEIDTEKTLEQTKVFEAQLTDAAYSRAMQILQKDVQWGKMIELTDEYIESRKLQGQAKQKALLNKVGVQRRQGNLAGAVTTLLEIVAVDPETGVGKEAQRQLDEQRVKALEQELGQ